jgi:hypothetical protein
MRVIPIVQQALIFLLRENREYAPISTSLAEGSKLMEEGSILEDRTLSDERDTVCPVCLRLADAMPVLRRYQRPCSTK